MAILYGTQSNGETLPVLVDQFGNLLAKGIDGQPGTPGTPGTPGEPGPPGADGGDFPLPPDPYEGAFLGWLNNGLAWIGTPPVPVPEGRFGPITGWDPAGLLTVGGEIPEQIKQGVFVYQCNEDGSIYVDGWNNSQSWSDGFIPTSSTQPWTNPQTYAFDGYLTTYAFQNLSSLSWSNPSGSGVTSIGSGVRVYSRESGGVQKTFTLNGGQTTSMAANGWTTINVGSESYFNSFTIGGGESYLASIEVNGKILVDAGEYPSAPNLNFRVQSVSGQNLIGTVNRTDNFSIGKYLRVPDQNVARWLYDGNLSKVITSTGIDFSRLAGN